MDIILHKKIHIRILLILTALVVLSGSKCKELVADLPDTCVAETVIGPVEYPCDKKYLENQIEIAEDTTPKIDNRDLNRFDSAEYTPVANNLADVAGKWLLIQTSINTDGLLYERYTCLLSEKPNTFYDSDCAILKSFMQNSSYPNLAQLELSGTQLFASQVITESIRRVSNPSRKYYRFDSTYTLYIELTMIEPGKILGKIFSSSITEDNHEFEDGIVPEGEGDFSPVTKPATFEPIEFTMVRLGDANAVLGNFKFRNRSEARNNPDLAWGAPSSIYHFYESEQHYDAEPNETLWTLRALDQSYTYVAGAGDSKIKEGELPDWWKLRAKRFDEATDSLYIIELDIHHHHLQNDANKTLILHNSIFESPDRWYEEMKELLIEIVPGA